MAGESLAYASELSLDGVRMRFLRIQPMSKLLVNWNDDLITGDLDTFNEQLSDGLKVHRFRIWMRPSPTELDTIFPLLSMAESPTDTFTISNTYPSFTTIFRLIAKNDTFSTCYVDKWAIMYQAGQPFSMMLEILATSMAEGADGSLGSLDSDIIFASHEAVLTLEGSSRSHDRCTLISDARMAVFYNESQTATAICPTRRTTHIMSRHPFTSSETALRTNRISGITGAAGTLVFTRAGQSTSIALANLVSDGSDPGVLSKDQAIKLPFNARVVRTNSTASVIVTHDATA